MADAVPALKGYSLVKGFKNATGDDAAPITKEELEQEYCKCTRQPYPIPEIVFARSWMLFRVSLVDPTSKARC